MQEQDKKEFANTEREGWKAKDVSKEGVNQMPDETMRQILRGGKSGENGDDHDVVGSADKNETPQGREEAKPDSK